jgi:hypothetical protein
MYKRLMHGLLASIVFVSLFQGQEKSRQLVKDDPSARLEVRLSGSDVDPVMVIRLHNDGDLPYRVDKELVFLLSVECVDRNKVLIPMTEDKKDIVKPDNSALKARFAVLKHGEFVERQIDLRKGFKCFRVGKGSFLPEERKPPIISAYENICFLEPNAVPASIFVKYDGQGLQFEGLSKYLGKLKVPNLYRGSLMSIVNLTPIPAAGDQGLTPPPNDTPPEQSR